jgi:hypothetical protein
MASPKEANQNQDKTEDKDKAKRWKVIEKGLPHWQALAETSQEAHYDSARHYMKKNNWMGVPATIFSAVVGGSVFASLDKGDIAFWMRIVLSVISVTAAMLSALQTFLHYGDLVERHHNAAAGYGAIHVEIECTKFIPIEDRDDPKEVLNGLKNRMEALEKDSPPFPERIWAKYEGTFESIKKNIASDYY